MEFIANIFIGKIILYRSVWSKVKSRYIVGTSSFPFVGIHETGVDLIITGNYQLCFFSPLHLLFDRSHPARHWLMDYKLKKESGTLPEGYPLDIREIISNRLPA